jgi:PelA/Pel-15E family pectate lyase
MKQAIILILSGILFWNVAGAQAAATDPVAENILLFQRSVGGWPKHFNEKAFEYTTVFSADEKAQIAAQKNNDDATIDNKATNKEIRYLVAAYKKTNNPQYLTAAENGIRYLLKAQYDNGGWPQYYPDKRFYRAEITFNDNAMINSMNVLQDVALGKNDLGVVSKELIAPSAKAIAKGIDCILKTQIKANGKLTAWCQQYDQNTLQPAKARAYELPSISGAESDDIVEFLMSQPNPSQQIKDAINAAVQWFQEVKITGYKFDAVSAPGTAKGTDRQLVPDSSSVIWARYYEIGTNKPFFCDRDGVKKYSIQEIGYERRNGYAWFGEWPKKLLEKTYPAWVKKNGK